MPYPNRIIVYLKGPSGGEPAAMNALRFMNPAEKATEAALIRDGLRNIPSGEEVAFSLATTRGISEVTGLMITWPGGCRITVKTLLGEKGNGVSDEIGVLYDNTDVAPPCDIIHCRFNGAGLLTYEDRQGVTVVMDTCKPGVSGLCLTLVPKPACHAAAKFPGGEFPNLEV